MILYLALHVALHRIEIGVAHPVRRALHSAGDLVGDLRHLVVLATDDGAIRGRARVLAGAAVRALTGLLGALLQLVGQRCLQLAGALAHLLLRLADLVPGGFRRGARAHRPRRDGEGCVGTLRARPEPGVASARASALPAGAPDVRRVAATERVIEVAFHFPLPLRLVCCVSEASEVSAEAMPNG